MPNNVFAGRDGKVYRRDDTGWRVNQGRTWNPAPPEVSPPAAPSSRPATPAREPMQNWPPPSRYQRPTPVGQPTAGQPPHATPARQPVPHAPPEISPRPGNLEREFQGRVRAGNPGGRPVAGTKQKPPEKK